VVKGGPVSVRMDTRPSFRAYASNGIQVLLTFTLSLSGKGKSKGVFDCPFLTVGQLFWPQCELLCQVSCWTSDMLTIINCTGAVGTAIVYV